LKTVILGKGVSGKAAQLLANELSYESVIVNDGEVTDVNSLFDGVDFVVASPGFSYVNPLIVAAQERAVPILSELEFGFRHFDGPLLAVTGTNGKTTTTELTVHLLNHCGRAAIGCGNLGLPLSAVANQQKQHRLSPGMIAVTEVSSFQLEHVERFAPDAAVLLNLAEDHLDRYAGKLAEYAETKRRIFRHIPKKNCIYGLNFSSELHRALLDGTVVTFDGKPILSLTETVLGTLHNAENCCGAVELIARLAPELLFTREFADGLRSFRIGRHRLEEVGTFGGFRWVDDSKATNPASAVAALKRFAKDRVHLILGGLDKGVDFQEMLPLPPCVRSVSLIGTAAPILEKQIDGIPVRNCGTDFAAAIAGCAQSAQKGDVILLSPACASMDMFRDYEDRGSQFRAAAEHFGASNQ